MKVAFLTLGCKVNFYETEKMIGQFRERGCSVVEFSEQADIYVINTCTVTNIADRKSRQMIHRAKKKNPNGYIVAVGCYVESGGEALRDDPAVDAVFSNREKDSVAELVLRALGAVRGDGSGTDEPGGRDSVEQPFRKDRTRAYLKIQDGCNQFCSYCMIPYVRGGGKLSSMPAEKVVCEVRQLAAKGYKEVVLTGIHLSSYGVDSSDAREFVRHGGTPLLSVIRAAAGVEGIHRIRLGSLEPRIISERFAEELAGIPKICPHFHLSLQSGCDAVLKRMNRHYTTVEYKNRVELLRKYFARPAITTDVIVGFPGETEGEFEQTRAFLQEIKLADIHVFKYSPRTGTKAAGMEEQVPSRIKNDRSERLIRDVEKYRREYGAYFMGKTERILFEDTVVEEGEAYLSGRNERYVRIGVPLETARKKGYWENEIRDVKVEKILFK